MKIEIRTVHPIHIIGKHLTMSLSNNRTVELWKSTMPLRRLIPATEPERLFSIQIYKSSDDVKDVNAEFVKWAGQQVPEQTPVPEGLEALTLPAGSYAVFFYSGGPQGATDFFRWVFGEWLPQNNFCLDQRPHFEILPSDYMAKGGMTEEEVWIPIKVK